MVFLGMLLTFVLALALLLSIRPCMNMCRRVKQSFDARPKGEGKGKGGGLANGAPRSADGVPLMELPEKKT